MGAEARLVEFRSERRRDEAGEVLNPKLESG